MRRITVQDELQEGFELAPTPAIGPDGGLGMAALRVVTPPRPRLCEAGPCRNYHRFEIQVEAAHPRAQTVAVALPAGTPGAQPVPGGTVYQAPTPFHVETHHYCYPTSGVEMALGALPVVICNRWDPYHDAITRDDGDMHENRRAFLASPEGVEYLARVADWDVARQRELAEAAEVDQLIADSLRDTEKTEGDPR